MVFFYLNTYFSQIDDTDDNFQQNRKKKLISKKYLLNENNEANKPIEIMKGHEI